MESNHIANWHLCYRQGTVPAIYSEPESGAEGNRTPDPLSARQVLSQLSYSPNCVVRVGLEPTASCMLALSQLSYRTTHVPGRN